MAEARRDLVSYLREVADPRRQAGLRHPLAETLCMVVMGMMSGCCAYRELGRFVHHNRQELVSYLGLRKARVPSYVTLRDILQRLDFEALSRAFALWSGQHVDWSGQWLSVDGKSLRSTVSGHDSAEQNFVGLVSAFCQRTGLVQQAVRLENGKSSEIASARQLIERLEGRGLLLRSTRCTAKKTAALISSAGHAYLIKVKGNQAALLAAIKGAAESGPAQDLWQEEQRSRGRSERRRVALYPASPAASGQWPGLRWFVCVTRSGKRQGRSMSGPATTSAVTGRRRRPSWRAPSAATG